MNAIAGRPDEVRTVPTFSVIMPAYNAGITIAAAIESVLAQTRSDFELIVIDDGSTDGTVSVVETYVGDPRIRLFRQENHGPATTRNRGLQHAQGRYVSMLDSDDLWMPNYLEVMGQALDADAEAGFAYTDAWVLDDRRRRILRSTAMFYQDPPLPAPADPAVFLAELVRRNFIFTSTTVRRSVFEHVGYYDDRLQSGEDYELWLRIVAHRYRAIRPPGILAVYRKSPGTLSTNQLQMVEGLREAYRLVAEEYADLPPRLRSLARARMRKYEKDARALRGQDLVHAARYHGHAHLVRLKINLLRWWLWRRRPPAEVLEAFPSLLDNGPRSQTASNTLA